MTTIYSNRYDTPEIAALRDEINADDKAFIEFVRNHRLRERERLDMYSRLLLEQRPEYPPPPAASPAGSATSPGRTPAAHRGRQPHLHRHHDAVRDAATSYTVTARPPTTLTPSP